VSLLKSSNERLQSSYYCLSVILAPDLAPRRADIMAAMTRQGVGTSVYYPQPVPRMTYYARKYGWADGMFPNATRIADNSLALSVGPHLSTSDMPLIAEALAASLKEVMK